MFPLTQTNWSASDQRVSHTRNQSHLKKSVGLPPYPQNPARRNPQDQTVSQATGSPTISLSLGEDFLFFFKEIIDADCIETQQQFKDSKCIRLSHGIILIWNAADDHKFKHGVWPPSEVRAGMRWSIVFRWSSLGADKYESSHPFRKCA